MEFNLKSYKITKTKAYLKKEKFLFLLNNINHNSNSCIIFEQTLKSLCFNYYKTFNKLTNNILKNSIYKNIHVINGIIFFIKPQPNAKIQIKQQSLINNFEILLFTLLSIKLNNKIYTVLHFKNSNSLEYKENKLALYQFKASRLKIMFTKNNLFSK
jgi:hypothetical protein